jgi:sarcosine oxidase
MPAPYDCLIAGLGAMGSAAACHLAQAGQKVLGLDQFAPPHAFGSSHGQTRIIREAYFEDPAYVPLVQRAYELWAELAQASSAPIFLPTGGLMIGPPDGLVVGGARASAERHQLVHEVLSAAEVRRRFPALQPADTMVAVWEPRAGVLFPEQCIRTHLAVASRHGAELRLNEPVLSWQADQGGVRVTTTRGDYSAGQLILSAGSWIGSLLPELASSLRIERQVMFWFEAAAQPALFQPAACPIHLWEFDRQQFFYGFPDLGEGIKVACHHDGEATAPGQVRREVAPEEIEAMLKIVRRFLPQAAGRLRAATVCMYTNTPDGHFWIDRHPQHPQVWIASPCSGHGFKFSSVVGEILSELVLQGKCRFDLDLFKTRFPPAAFSP